MSDQKTFLLFFVPQPLDATNEISLHFGPVVSKKKSFESVDGRQTEDGGFPSYKLLPSFRLRAAEKVIRVE